MRCAQPRTPILTDLPPCHSMAGETHGFQVADLIPDAVHRADATAGSHLPTTILNVFFAFLCYDRGLNGLPCIISPPLPPANFQVEVLSP